MAAAQKSEQASEVLNSVDRLKAEMDELRTRWVGGWVGRAPCTAG